MKIPFDITPTVSIPLQTKSLTCFYEQGLVRYIRHGNTELVRMVYCAVRDSNWETVPFSIFNEKIIQYNNSFIVLFSAKYSTNGIEYEAEFSIEGNENDTITFDMKGSALSAFDANRIGFCVHLPVDECRNQECVIGDAYNQNRYLKFPCNIAPYQPFTGIQRMQWQAGNNINVELSFSGDEFEMEDQRNWMDNSYKIYSRPLDLPFPFFVDMDDATEQTLQLTVLSSNDETGEIEYIVDNAFYSLPILGIAAVDDIQILTNEYVSGLNELPFVLYRAELDFEKDWESLWLIHCANAIAINAKLELILFFTDDYIDEAGLFLEIVSDHADLIKTILPQHKSYKVTPVFLQEYFYPLIKKLHPAIQVGYGTDIYFAQLNRQRPENNLYDFVSFSVNPQVHSFDVKTIVENINALSDIIATTRSFTSKPIVISPVTFKKRKNHDGAGTNRHELVNNYDERQDEWFGAAWFLLCLYALRDAQQVSFFKTTGDSGVIKKNKTTPLFKLLKKIKDFEPTHISRQQHNNAIQIIFKNMNEEELTFGLDEKFLHA